MNTANLFEIKKRINAAALRAGRDPSDIELIAVSKYKPAEDILEAYNAGQRNFGENHVQELVSKIELLPGDIKWHMIGNLQKNKVKYIADKVCMIHSVGSVSLAEQIQKEAEKKNCDVDILLEVNVAGEESKSGFSAEEVYDAAMQIAKLSRVHIKGLMTVAPFVNDPEENRPVFKKLHDISVDIERKKVDNISMRELSMGMSGDFEVAVEEGATFVRVGTAIFGERDYSKN